jgi:hypothetical protein
MPGMYSLWIVDFFLFTHAIQNYLELYIQTYTLLSKINCNIYFVTTISRKYVYVFILFNFVW